MMLTAPALEGGEAWSTVDGNSEFHAPVMVDETLELLLQGGVGRYLDGTVGGGGHSRAVLEQCVSCSILAVDRDQRALDRARANLEHFGDRVGFVHARFDRALLAAKVDEGSLAGALLDLGVSSHQIDEEERGFTFRRGAPLDMRMGGRSEGRPTAADLLNDSSEDELFRIFRELGEERKAGRLAREIVRRRATEPFEVSDQLVAALATTLGRAPSTQDKARIFQALRIEINEELDALRAGLPALREALRPGGVLAVIAYHSLEDRIVKHAFREWSRECVCPPELPICRCRGRALGSTLTKGPVRPSGKEVEANPRARSARLRGWRKAE